MTEKQPAQGPKQGTSAAKPKAASKPRTSKQADGEAKGKTRSAANDKSSTKANTLPAAQTSKGLESRPSSKPANTKSTGSATPTKKPQNRSAKSSKTTKKKESWLSDELYSFFDRVSGVTNSALKLAKKTTDTSYKVGKAIIQSQDQLKLMVAAGESLRDLREVAGLTANELSDAINLKDKTLIEAVENGTATLSFELILRLSALLARNDPIPFVLKYTRTYSPDTWKLLDDWGAGRLPLQYERERKFINIFRSKDAARALSDEGFNKVLEFTREAFNMALHFVAEQELELQARNQLAAQLKPKESTSTDAESDTLSKPKQNN